MSGDRVNVHTSPATRGVVEYLKKNGPQELKVIVADCGWSWNYLASMLLKMRDAGYIHVHGWRSTDFGGAPAKVWAYGKGVDAPRPKAKDRNSVQRAYNKRKRATLADQYGHDVAGRILKSLNQGGASSVVVDGRVIYRRYDSPSCNRRYRDG